MSLLAPIVASLDKTLRHDGFPDYSGAHNGLQVENNGRITRIGAAVDAHVGIIEQAIAQKVDLLLVHHGLFWSPVIPVTGVNRRKLDLLLAHNLAVYASHLPLDAHPTLGNNALLARALGWTKTRPFFDYKGVSIGLQTTTSISRDELSARACHAVGAEVTLLKGGPATCRHIGLVTGGGGGDIAQAIEAGVDTFITGEGPHWTYGLAREAGINVIYAGHYATETFGVKALAEFVSKKFKVPWVFLDDPSGL
jgi:dinuclear metal center YbgI/SA1388 family protein